MAKYNKETKEVIFNSIASGDTQLQACVKAGIVEGTFYRWQEEKKEFKELVKKAHSKYRETLTHKLENSLYKRATGYTVTETETEYKSDKDGNPVIKSQKVREKAYPPDMGALAFSLCNIAPEKWKNRQHVQAEDVTNKPQVEIDDYYFENLPEDLLFNVADALQEQKYDTIKKEKENGKGNKKE